MTTLQFPQANLRVVRDRETHEVKLHIRTAYCGLHGRFGRFTHNTINEKTGQEFWVMHCGSDEDGHYFAALPAPPPGPYYPPGKNPASLKNLKRREKAPVAAQDGADAP